MILLAAPRASTQETSVNFGNYGTVGANPPHAPTGTAKSGPDDGQITLNWTPAASGRSATNWVVGYQKVGDSTYTTAANLGAGARTYTISGLDKSFGYNVRLSGSVGASVAWVDANNVAAVASTPPPTPPPPPPPPVITSAEGVTYSGNAQEGFSLTPLGEGGSIVYRRRTIDLTVTRDECTSPDNPAVIIPRNVLDRVREITFEISVSPQDPPPGFRMEGCVADIDPGVRLGQRETVTVCLPPSETEGKSYVHRYDGEWKRLESRLETVNGEELLCGETDAISLFGVFFPVIDSAEGVSHSEDEEYGFSLTPLGVGGSIVYGERTIDISVTGDVASSDPAVIVPRSILDQIDEITFELQEVSPHDPPPGLRLKGFAAEVDLGVTLGEEETVTVCLPSSGGDIYRYNDELGEWEVLESRLETVNEEEVLCAETGAFSLTGVFVEETGGCAVAAVNWEGTARWQGAVFNLLLAISVLLLLPKLGVCGRKAASG